MRKQAKGQGAFTTQYTGDRGERKGILDFLHVHLMVLIDWFFLKFINFIQQKYSLEVFLQSAIEFGDFMKI